MAEMSETKTPKPGEWWLRNSGGRIFYICGFDPEGWVVHWNENVGFFSSKMRFFCREHHHEPRCTGFGWVEPTAIDPGEGYELLPVGTILERYDQVLGSTMTGTSWMDTAYFGECVGSRPGLEGPYRRKIKPVESPEDWVTQDRCAVRCGSDEVRWSKWEPDEWSGPLRFWPLQEIHGYVDPDDGSTLSIRCRRKDLPVEPLTPVETPDDWVEYDALQITCPRISVDWLTPKAAGQPFWDHASNNWSDTLWTAHREKWKIRCRRRDLPVEPDNMAAIIAEHTQQVRELTQRIGELGFRITNVTR